MFSSHPAPSPSVSACQTRPTGSASKGYCPQSGQCFCLFEDASTRIPGLKALRFPPRKRGGASVIHVDPVGRACLLSPCEDGSGCDENRGRALPISTVKGELIAWAINASLICLFTLPGRELFMLGLTVYDDFSVKKTMRFNTWRGGGKRKMPEGERPQAPANRGTGPR